MLRKTFVGLGALGLLVSSACAAGVPDDCTQLIVGIAPTWNSMRGELQLFERSPGAAWQPVTARWPVLFGKHGLAWGSGVDGQNESGLRKSERAGRSFSDRENLHLRRAASARRRFSVPSGHDRRRLDR